MRIGLTLGILGFVLPLQAADFTLTVLHTNDVHSRLESTAIRGKQYGGYSRVATLVKKFRQQDPNAILLSAGDVFQGTLYFNVYEGLADLAAMNATGYTAMAAGNHEFDKGPSVFGAFCRATSFPVLCANIDVSNEPSLKDWIKPSTVVNIGGESIGIIGVVTPDLPFISSPGPTVKMLNLHESITNEVKKLEAIGINKIIVLSHCGYEFERDEIASKIPGVDMVVGGHSHTLLGKATAPGFTGSRGPYPTIVKRSDGSTALVVQAWEWGKVLGRIKVTFDDKGTIKSWSDDQPIVVDETVPEDPLISSIVMALQKPIQQLANKVIGDTKNGLPRNVSGRQFLNPIAFVIADAQLAAVKKQGAVAGFINAGGVRAPIEPGPITYGEAIAVQPFSNSIVLLELTGAELKSSLEWGVRELPDGSGGMLYPSAGTAYTVDPSKPVGERVVELTIDGKQVEMTSKYLIAINGFTANGGDAHAILKDAKGRRVDTGIVDIDALVDFITAHNPLDPPREPRIIVKRGTTSLKTSRQNSELDFQRRLSFPKS